MNLAANYDYISFGDLTGVNNGAIEGAEWALGDFDWDGDIDLNDLSNLASNYGLGEAQAFADFQLLTSVPEPVTLLPLLGVLFFSRKRGSACV